MRPTKPSPSPAAAFTTVFTSALAPTSADTLAQYAAAVARLAPAGYHAALARRHEQALDVNPELARLMRSDDALADVGDAAEHLAHPIDRESIAEARARCSAAAQRDYQRAICEQLVARDGHELRAAAQVILDAMAREDQVVADAVEAQREFDRQRELAAAAERDRHAAERLARRERARQIIEGVAQLSEVQRERERELRAALSDSLIERLDGVSELRASGRFNYDAESLRSHARARSLSLQQLVEFHHALDEQEDRSAQS